LIRFGQVWLDLGEIWQNEVKFVQNYSEIWAKVIRYGQNRNLASSKNIQSPTAMA